ncbi:MAG: diguanylate cyclase (GGDEF)-like protein/PAS domain S-box-containing protein [Candidatus Azotimanducaceae bacterium]|jgi:diguanylate cyclase (GGDEF)-like protein/PAS domain S-box-containing protein
MTPEQSKDAELLGPLEENQQSIENYFDVVFNNVGDPLFVKDEECRLLLVNDAFCSLFGLTRTEMIGKTLAEKVPTSEMEHFLSIDRQVLKDGIESLVEETLTANGAPTKTILTRKSRFLDRKGRHFLVGVIHDISELKHAQNVLIQKEERLSLALRAGGIGIWELNLKTQELIWDESMYPLFNVRVEDFSGHLSAWEETVHPDDIEYAKQELQAASSGKKPLDIEFRVVWPNGEVRHISAIAKLFHDKGGKPVRMLGINTDISERKEAEEKIKLAASVFSHAGEGIMITDIKGNIVDVNDTFSHITGYSHEEIVGLNPRTLSSGRQSAEFYKEMWDSLQAKGRWSGEMLNRHKNGTIYPERLNISSVQSDRGQPQHYVAIFADITKMKAHQGQMEHIAHYDPLTDLPNRVLLSSRLNYSLTQCARRNQSLAVAFLDLDEFKAINDNHGHDVGDELLNVVSKRMVKALRQGDTLARIGGDEFVAVLVDLEKPEDCLPVLERLLQAVSTPIIIGESVLYITASIGVATYPQDNVDTDELMRHADQAMYEAKRTGKNRFLFFDSKQDNIARERHEKLTRIRAAFDQHEFVLLYQPKVNMRTGVVTGVEALIRWQHPEFGLLDPIEFLPIIENHAMIIELGEWVIESALTQISKWQETELTLPICTSVNIAASQLQQPEFAERLATLLANHPEVESRYLELEILETSGLENVQHVSEIMNTCMAQGVNFALDDFGTGYSSLTYLRRLPVNLIKIDQSFVRDMLDDADDLAIVEGVIALAKSFKRDVIAEGVETIEHGTALLQLGCDLAQGYGIAKPMPAKDVPEWIAKWQPDEAWEALSI